MVSRSDVRQNGDVLLMVFLREPEELSLDEPVDRTIRKQA
jgi:hypothetical protein